MIFASFSMFRPKLLHSIYLSDHKRAQKAKINNSYRISNGTNLPSAAFYLWNEMKSFNEKKICTQAHSYTQWLICAHAHIHPRPLFSFLLVSACDSASRIQIPHSSHIILEWNFVRKAIWCSSFMCVVAYSTAI